MIGVYVLEHIKPAWDINIKGNFDERACLFDVFSELNQRLIFLMIAEVKPVYSNSI
ncbi:hypothetical protein GCM10007414_13260 [Agarivorans gilvus]|uniref:Uncharacterized protein n=1 Tax=Agarivorans gilvus TaxID=680279 RepID=A0ABQ1I1N3_9ALTE|nr:hypothetical protein GCM10007414_13260 [Agarivorans gilvus]